MLSSGREEEGAEWRLSFIPARWLFRGIR
jgi:hypothetical protein